MPKLDPRPVDDLLVVHSPSAWIDPVRIGAVAIRLPSDLWSTPYGGEFLTMADAIRHARAESKRLRQTRGTIAIQAARIRDVEAERDAWGVELVNVRADRDDLRRKLDRASATVRLLQWLTLAAGVVGYALASVGGAS